MKKGGGGGGGAYTLHGKLGAGGYGSVFLGRDRLGIRYAVKVLPKSRNPRERVQNEVELMRSLSHSTRVPRLIEACEDAEAYYVVQEWCRGGTLRRYCTAGGHGDLYGENTVASIVRGVLRGLCHVHAAGVVHRDIKGANVAFADAGDDAEVRLIDFGAAVRCPLGAALVESEELVGTPWFVSPEGLGHAFTFKSDVWSVGVLCYQLLSGRMPFDDRQDPARPALRAVFRSIFNDEPRMEGGVVWDQVSDDAKDFVRRCLRKSHADRPTAEEALDHPWLRRTDCADRFTGTPLVVSPFDPEDRVSAMMRARTM